jgi:uncharacterized membrane protein YdbT with pleckstrin-like domain
MNREIVGLRNHKLSLLENTWGVLVGIIVLFLGQVEDIVDTFHELLRSGWTKGVITSFGLDIGIFLLILIVGFGLSYFRWKKTTLSIKDGMIVVERKTFFAKKDEISIKNVSNVNLEQNVFERLTHIYKVKFDTSTLSTADKTDVFIVLGLEDAMKVRDLVMSYITDGSMYGDAAAESNEAAAELNEAAESNGAAAGQEEYDFRLDESDNMAAAIASIDIGVISGFSLGIIAALIIFVLMWNAGERVSSIIPLVIIPLTACYYAGKSIVKSFVRYHDFRVKRRGDMIYISSGALKLRSYSVPVNQIQAVRMKCALLGRFMGRASVNVINVGGEDEDVDGQWLFPAIPIESIEPLMKQVLPEFEFKKPEEMEKRSKKSLIRDILDGPIEIIIWSLIGFGIGEIIAFVSSGHQIDEFGESQFIAVPIIVVIGLVLLYSILCLFFKQSVCRIAFDKDRLWIREGSLNWNYHVIDFSKVQYMRGKQKLVSRILGTKGVSLHILASRAASNVCVSEYDSEVIDGLMKSFSESLQ